MIQSIYYQFVNFIQELDAMWYAALILGLFACSLLCVVSFFKVYNGTQKKFEKLGKIVLALLLLLIMIFLVNVR